MVGESLGNFRVLSQIGEGGMGRVYLAEHVVIGRKAAIKVLLPQYSANQEIVDRFFNEARALAQLRHPGLVDVLDFGYHSDGSAFLVMEMLEGQSLSSRLKKGGALPHEEATEVARQVAAAVAAAHEKGIVHRDLKPDNIHLVEAERMAFGRRAKVLDFGIAKLAGGGGDKSSHTRTGIILGTPAYMSPEQCRDTASVDHRTDVYALGCILFEMLCGRTPFVSLSLGDLFAAHMRDAPPDPRSIKPALPEPLAAVVLRMLAKDPGDRPATMAEVVAALDPGGTRARPPSGRSALIDPAAPGARTRADSTDLVTRGGDASGSPAAAPSSFPLVGKRAVAILAGTALVLVVAAVTRFALGRGGATPAADPAPALAPAPVSAPPVVPALAAPPRSVKLSIESVPLGAEVLGNDGAVLGNTPFQEEVASSTEARRYTLRLDGYHEKSVPLIPDKDRGISVDLLRAPGAAPPRRPVERFEAAAPVPTPRKPAKPRALKPFEPADPAPPPAP